MIDWSDYPHFEESEFRCRCCDLALMEDSFMIRLELIRFVYGRPMIVNSGYRCPDQNERVSSTGRDGPHTSGRAADFRVSGHDAFALLALAIGKGMTGLGIKQHGKNNRFLHLDDLSGETRPWVWSYK